MSDAADILIRVLADADSVAQAAAIEFVRLAQEAVASKSRFAVALAGGSTPRRLYERLASQPTPPSPPLGKGGTGGVDWSTVEFFWGDERCVPADHTDSNFRMAYESMLRKLQIQPNRIYRLEGARSDRDAAARDYEEEIAKVFGVSRGGTPPAFDLVLLGMGADGHTASLFPHTEALRQTERWVVANYVAKLQTERLTMTPAILNAARYVIFLVTGEDKAATLAEVLTGPHEPDRLPSQFIRPVHGTVLWLVDRAAASQLPPPSPSHNLGEGRGGGHHVAWEVAR